jgi:hypothetical protein
MRNLLAVSSIAWAATLTPFGAQAQFSASDSTLGAHSLVTDSVSGLTWLNLDVTVGQTFNSVAHDLSVDPQFADFRIATRSEVVGLFYDAGFCVGAVSCGITDPARLSAGASFAGAFNGITHANGSESFLGYLGGSAHPIDPAHDVYSLYRAGTGYDPSSPTVSTAFDDYTSPVSSQSAPDTGTWLVAKTVVSPVPEPSAWALMLAGIAAVALVFKRRTRSRDA